jgi:acetyl esterase/lipase
MIPTQSTHRRNSILLVILLSLFATACAQNNSPLPPRMIALTPSTQPDAAPMRLWPGDAPGALGQTPADIPTLSLFLPTGPSSGAAMIICPGGSYWHLSPREGPPVARWLNAQGIACFVIKNRLGPRYHHPMEVQDSARAVRFVRAHAADWNIDPHRIGILGFSAGGHFAATCITHFDAGNPDDPDPIERVSSRPDLAILMYPVITMFEPYAHIHSRDNLLGKNPSDELKAAASPDLHVSPRTPPCFIVETSDDTTTVVENTFMFATALHKNHVPFEMHIFEHGKHGFAMADNDPVLRTWQTMAADWLTRHNFTLSSPPTTRASTQP